MNISARVLSLGAVVIFASRWIFDLPDRFLDIWGVEQTEVLIWHEPALRNGHVASSIFAQDTVTAATYLSYGLIYKLGLSPESVFIALSVLQLAIAAIAIHAIGARVAGSSYGGSFAVAVSILAPTSLLGHASIGYELDFSNGYFPGMFAMSLGLVAIALWLWERPLATAFFIGLFADYHPTAAALIGLPFVLDRLLWRGRRWSETAMLVAVMAVAAIPAAFMVAAALGRPVSAIDWDAWWLWVQLRKGFHVMPWRDPSLLGPFVVLLGVYGLCLILAARGRLIETRMVRRLWLLLGTSLALFAVNIVLIEGMRWPLAAALFLTRLTAFLPPIAAGLVFAALLAATRRFGAGSLAVFGPIVLLLFLRDAGRSDEALFATLFIASILWIWRNGPRGWIGWCVILPVPAWAALRYALSPNGWTWLRAGPLARIGLYVDPNWFASYLALAVIGLAVLLATRVIARETKGALAWVPFAAGVAAVGIADDVWLFQPAALHAAAVRDLDRWAATSTEPGSVLAVPPELPCADYCLGRLALLSWEGMGVSDYATRAFPAEQAALRAQYGVDLHDPVAVAGLRADLPDALRQRFYALTDGRAAALRQLVPQTRYVVAERPTSSSARFLPELALPIAHENAWYRVYDLAPARQ